MVAFTRRRFRLSPAFRLVPASELADAERDALGGLQIGRLHAVLVPRAPGRTAKAVDPDTTLLLASLVSPARLDAAARMAIAIDVKPLQRLVLDGVLEIEDGAQFVGGPAAAPIVEFDPALPIGDGATALASERALTYGTSLDLRDAATLSARLYMYGRQPASPAWRRRLCDVGAVERWLGLDPHGSTLALTAPWRPPQRRKANPEWIYLRRPNASNRRLKLYVAVAPETLPEALPILLRTFARYQVGSFKVGGTLRAVLRPDKLVAYLDSREQLEALAAELQAVLRGLPAQPVAFTAGLDASGLLAWGVDPPPDERVSSARAMSWRGWITDHLAVALIAGQHAGLARPTDYARRRLALDGVDPSTWAPSGLAWAQELVA